MTQPIGTTTPSPVLLMGTDGIYAAQLVAFDTTNTGDPCTLLLSQLLIESSHNFNHNKFNYDRTTSVPPVRSKTNLYYQPYNR